ncbi:MAG: DegT/DnrJ/EryC1/StrS family aminotransferase [Proteobacteria bacterium]|nr:DegT/DnrJ/EryC1/StrS family aminotransferase [Pseudomonadota bacterium]
MPGFELVGQEELAEISDIFSNANGVQFRLGFDQLRNGIFKVAQFENEFSKKMNCKHGLAVTSGTAALKVALKALGVGPGDEVITQAFTFVATIEAIVECGATPVIAQIDDNLDIDVKSLESLITQKTKAIIPVHMLGVPCDIKSIVAIGKKHGIKVIEDTAWGCGALLEGQALGTFGDMGCFSFDYAKALTTGEGGMIITNNSDIDFRARSYHDHGHENNPELKRWEDSRHGSGFNYRMTEMQGAFGLAQLRKLDRIIAGQRNIKSEVDSILGSEFSGKIRLRKTPKNSQESADALVFQVESPALALSCRNALLKEGISTKILPEALTWHFAGHWNHIPALLNRHGNLENEFKTSRQYLSCSVSLPISLNTKSDFAPKVVKSLKSVLI